MEEKIIFEAKVTKWIFFKSEEIYSYILQKISESKKAGLENNCNADEIMKYKQLLDNGIITQEEFDKKKQELLK